MRMSSDFLSIASKKSSTSICNIDISFSKLSQLIFTNNCSCVKLFSIETHYIYQVTNPDGVLADAIYE